MRGKVKDAGVRGFGFDAIFAGFGADIHLAPRCAVQLPQRLHFLFGCGQQIELAIAKRELSALKRLPSDGGITKRKQGSGRGLVPVAPRLHFA